MTDKKIIYTDNAATTRIDPLAFDAMLPFLGDDFSIPSSLHSIGKVARDAVELARYQIAECVGATPEEIFFTSCGTESDNWAIRGTAYEKRCKGNHLITSSIEHHAVLNCCTALVREGFTATLLPVDNRGLISADDLCAAILPDTTFVSIMMANNEIGTIQDVKLLATTSHQHAIVFHTDAIQAVGHIEINVADLGIDLLSASAHKFNGPKGIGFLYKRTSVQLPPFIFGCKQEFGIRAGTENVAGIVGMACALKNHIAYMKEEVFHIDRLTEIITSRVLAQIPDAKINGHPNQRLPGLISLSLAGISGESILHLLDLKRIIVSTGAACNSKETIVSHVLQELKLPSNYSAGTIRISLSKDNTEEEAIIIANAIISIYSKLRK